jgi:hypothetical protein
MDDIIKIEKDDMKGAFDKEGGGELLEGLESLNEVNLDSKNEELERLKKEYESMPMPKKNPAIKRKRYNLNKKIKKIEKELEKDKEENSKKDTKNLDLDDEYTRFDNLAEQLKYKHFNFKRMPYKQFQKEKLNILSRADRHYTKPAKIITDVLIKMSHITDGYEVIKGYSIDLTEGRENIEIQIRACLINSGMKGNNIVSSLSNPYIGLGLALSMPLIARYYYNKSELKEGEKKFDNNIPRVKKVDKPTNPIEDAIKNRNPDITVGIEVL